MVFLRSVVFFVFVFVSIFSDAQAPERINYQAVARNTQTGTELVNEDIFLSAQVRQGGPNGTIIYQESHANVVTDEFGLFSIQVGGGNVITGNFSQIPWSDGNFWLQVDVDAGQGLQNAGAMQFLSVPYALHANSATNVDDADADPTNELVQDLTFEPNTRQLTLVQEGENVVTELGTVVEGLSLDPDTYVLNLEQQGPTNQEVNLSPLRQGLDQSDQNELINPGWPVLLPGNILQIREADIDHEVDFSPLMSPSFWDQNTDETAIYNTTDNVGIGIENPAAKLEVRGNSNDNLLRIEDDNSVLLSVQNSKVGIGRAVGTSNVQIAGSVAYEYIKLTNDGVSDYTIGPTDNFLVVLMVNGGLTFNIFIPEAISFPGRVITIKKIGSSNNVTLTFTDPLDLSPQNPIISGAQPQTRSFMSIGEDGWITLFRE